MFFAHLFLHILKDVTKGTRYHIQGGLPFLVECLITLPHPLTNPTGLIVSMSAPLKV